MRVPLLAAAVAFTLAGPARADCIDDVKAILVKSHTGGPYVIELVHDDISMTAELVPPSSVHATTEIDGATQEMTVIDGKGWMRIGETWSAMPDALAAAMMADIGDTVRILDGVTTTRCLGTQRFEGKHYLAFKYDIAAKGAAASSTLYADPTTNLPVIVLATETANGKTLNTRVTYRYDPGVTVSPPM